MTQADLTEVNLRAIARIPGTKMPSLTSDPGHERGNMES